MNENLRNIHIAIKNINCFFDHCASRPASIHFEKGNTRTGIKHRVFIAARGKNEELFNAVTLKDLLNKLVGFDYGLRNFDLFKQR